LGKHRFSFRVERIMTNTTELPPLPEPTDLGYEVRWGYDADDMRNHGIDCYRAGQLAGAKAMQEMAKQICDSASSEWAGSSAADGANSCGFCIAAINPEALK
jgi:hypothetical protein